MPVRKDLAVPSDIRYIYDGTLAGFYCCVFESVYTGTLPAEILSFEQFQPGLFPEKEIETDSERAERVRRSIPKKISPRAKELVETVFFSCLPQKEHKMLRFLLFAYRAGAKAADMLGHPEVAPLVKAEQHLLGERHLLLGFVRFSEYDGMLAAAISPKNFILPFIASHFAERFNTERFMIFDKTHRYALIHENRRSEILRMDDVAFPEASEQERQYRELWRRFYQTISIEARENPRCRMTHMPKRYWENMTEMRAFL